MKVSTTAELKRANQKAVLDFIYRRRKTSKLEIATELKMSRPTVNQNLQDLERLHLIEKSGNFASTGGRKAEAIAFVGSARVALGLEILLDSYEIVAINLYGDMIRSEKITCHFENSDAYFDRVCEDIKRFSSSLLIPQRSILGLGIVLQGLISSDGTRVTYGKLLNCTGLTIERFTKNLPYACSMIHDAEAAATVELWETSGLRDAVFFHIRSNLSGALIVGGSFLKGYELKSGVFEHMTIVPGGRACYCGKKGCAEAYCSIRALLQDRGSVESFFERLRRGSREEEERWQEYLRYLSVVIDNIHMLIDYDIILGGILARYLVENDIAYLHQLIGERTAFPSSRTFIRIARCAWVPIAKGAALPFVQKFLQEALPGENKY